MTFRPNYVPKTKKKINYKVILLLVVLFAIGTYYFISNYIQNQTPKEVGYAICGFSDSESRKVVLDKQTELNALEPITVTDYGTYGESLSLYEHEYNYLNVDPMVGRTITLTNLCDTTQQYTFLMGSNLDMRIQLEHLPVGFYSFDVISDLKHYALVSDRDLEDSFTTVVRNGAVKNAKLYAKQNLFDLQEEKILSRNYVFLEVTSEAPNQEDYDIVLDPMGGSLNASGNINYGSQYNGLVEMDEMYDAATGVKKILEEHGLRVLVTRSNASPINVYGKGGRIESAYAHHAKYYIQLSLETSGSDMDRGIMSLYSNFASNRFSVSVVSSILDNTTLQATPYEDGSNMYGVFQTRRVDGRDNSDLIREVGGVFTGAGDADPYFREIHDFAKESRRGMYGITLLYGYMTDDNDYNVWTTQKEEIINATAQGILAQLNINSQGE